jgi:cell division protein FtsI/penicillin-binding protein 2
VTAPSGEWGGRAATSREGDPAFPAEHPRWEGDYNGHAAPLGGQDTLKPLGNHDITVPFEALSVSAPPAPVSAPPVSAPPASTPPAETPPPASPPASAPPASIPPGRGSRRHRRAQADRPGRLKKPARMAAALIIFAAVLAIGFNTDFGPEPSPEPVVQSFLLDWEQQHYTGAASLTNGDPTAVKQQLAAEFHQLNATEMFFSMQSVRQHGKTAEATFQATVDLVGGEHQWIYNGRFGLVSDGGKWLINWAPSVVEPSLGPGDRLAVETTFPQRGQVTDATGSPLIPQSIVYHIGVYPSRLTNPRATAAGLSQVTGLNAQEVFGTISSAPPHQFLSLLTLDPGSYSRLHASLAHVKGLTVQSALARLFNDSNTFDEVGAVGTENASTLAAEGATYLPGMSVGQSGLEKAYQDTLVGTPDIAVVVVNAQGMLERTLWTSEGVPPQPVETTLSGKVQAAASASLTSLQTSGEIVAVDSANGHILALAGHSEASLPLPAGGLLNASIAPGAAFTIVSAAALLAGGLQPSSPLPCQGVANVGGQTFTYSPGQSPAATFASDFASGCGTALATVSLRLTPASLATTAKSFGVGAPWELPVPASSGSVSAASGEAALAAQAIGTGGVRMSPLSMALVAAEVDSGTGHSPMLLRTDPSKSWSPQLSASQLTELRGLMRQAVQTGPAHAADLSGKPVYGQAGVVQTGASSWLSWFVGYRGSMAFAVLETSQSQPQASSQAAAWQLAASFLSAVG